MHLKRAFALFTTIFTFSALLLVGPASATFGTGTGTVRLTLSAPVAGSGLVELHRIDGQPGVQHAVVSTAAGTSLRVATGMYAVVPRTLTVDGTRFVGRADRSVILVGRSSTISVSVAYAKSKGVQQVRVSRLAPDGIDLAWQLGTGQYAVVRRTVGSEPAAHLLQGKAVTATRTGLADSRLEPGKTYTYAIFTAPGDLLTGNLVQEPATITVKTPSTSPTNGEALYVLDPRTSILATGSITAATALGDGVRVTLAKGVAVPAPGEILSILQTPALPGGYLGEVVAVAEDGSTVDLVQAPLGAAFDFYYLATGPFGPASALAAAKNAPQATVGKTSVPVAPVGGQSEPRPVSLASERAAAGALAKATSTMKSSAAPKIECEKVGGFTVEDDIDLAHAGHYETFVNEREFELDLPDVPWIDLPLPDTIGGTVPVGAGWDIGYASTASAALDITAEVALECGIELPTFQKQLSVAPVPTAMVIEPQLEVIVSGKGAVNDLGFTWTDGFESAGYVGLDGDDTIEGDLIGNGVALEPTAQGSVGVGLNIAADLLIGAGVAPPKSDVGVIAGVAGELSLLDAAADIVEFTDEDGPDHCIELSAASGAAVMLEFRAWIPGWKHESTYELVDGSKEWGDYQWPDDCTQGETPTEDVLGDGVTMVDDNVEGHPDQWGKIDGMVPEASTWVLSTGRVQDAVGTPDFFASSDMETPGDAALEGLAGYPTNDAAAYSVTLIPNGDNLNIRYVFASEEYPDYVGSQFNDVMAVFVDGENCALVPGTQTPVSINTINQNQNSEFYVDNAAGAAGYQTTMGGLTTPLTCTVPVQRGEPVDVRIAVADASDSAYDSAIALLDGGIWSE